MTYPGNMTLLDGYHTPRTLTSAVNDGAKHSCTRSWGAMALMSLAMTCSRPPWTWITYHLGCMDTALSGRSGFPVVAFGPCLRSQKVAFGALGRRGHAFPHTARDPLVAPPRRRWGMWTVRLARWGAIQRDASSSLLRKDHRDVAGAWDLRGLSPRGRWALRGKIARLGGAGVGAARSWWAPPTPRAPRRGRAAPPGRRRSACGGRSLRRSAPVP